MKTVFASRSYAYHGYLLLADDDDDDRSEMHRFFRENGYRACCLASGKATLDYMASLWRQEYPAAIILDYHMPGLSGEDTLRHLKQSDAFWHIPVIVYSTEMNDVLCKRLQSLGAYGCFTKTHHLSEPGPLKHSLDTLLHYRSAVA